LPPPATKALRLEHNHLGCEHLLLGLAGGPPRTRSSPA
jgi:hypothetical protein